VFEYIVGTMVHGSGYEIIEIIACAGCSDRMIRRRVKEWAAKGLGRKRHQLALAAYNKIVGLELVTWPPMPAARKLSVVGTKPAPHR
jgi:hypothetical protein